MYYSSVRRKGPMVAVIIMLFLSISVIAFTYVYEHYFTTSTPQTTTRTTQIPSTASSSSTSLMQQIQQIAENAGLYGNSYQVAERANNDILIVETLKKAAATQIRPNIKSDCFSVQQAVWTSNFKISQLDLQFVGNAYDKYGNAISTTLGSCSLDSTTAKQFVWNNLTADTAWDQHAYTSTTLAPSVY